MFTVRIAIMCHAKDLRKNHQRSWLQQVWWPMESQIFMLFCRIQLSMDSVKDMKLWPRYVPPALDKQARSVLWCNKGSISTVWPNSSHGKILGGLTVLASSPLSLMAVPITGLKHNWKSLGYCQGCCIPACIYLFDALSMERHVINIPLCRLHQAIMFLRRKMRRLKRPLNKKKSAPKRREEYFLNIQN